MFRSFNNTQDFETLTNQTKYKKDFSLNFKYSQLLRNPPSPEFDQEVEYIHLCGEKI